MPRLRAVPLARGRRYGRPFVSVLASSFASLRLLQDHLLLGVALWLSNGAAIKRL